MIRALAALSLSLPACAPALPPAPRVDDGARALFEAERVRGAFALLEARTGALTIVSPRLAERRFSPASTFKVPNALISLETGVASGERFSLRWDGRARSVRAWNRDHDLASAMKASALWFYRELARRVGLERMRAWLARLGYGNRDTSGGVDRFWIDGSLRISPLEQVAFLRELQAGALPASARAQAVVRRLVELERTGGRAWHGKTGLTFAKGRAIGWHVGWVERGADVHVYALLVLAPREEAKRLLPLRPRLARALLRRYGVL